MFSRAVRRLYTPRASGSTPRARRAASGSLATSLPSTSTRPLSGRIRVYSIRSVVVLPAPLGPSSPVISPSRASKPTSSTATTRVLSLPLPLPGKVLRRCSAMIMSSGLPAVERGERRHVAQVVQAFAVERGRVGGVEELRHQLRHAAGADHVVALAAQHEEARVGQRLDHFLAVARRRDRVELALQDDRGHVAT